MSNKKLKPKILKPGDRVRVIAPASPFDKKVFKKGIGKIASMGVEVVFRRDIFSKTDYLAGVDKRRLFELHEAFSDKKTSAVFCARGGYGSTRLLQKIDFSILKKNPKLFVGFSDITALHLAIYARLKMPTIHGPMIASKRYISQPERFDRFLIRALFSKTEIRYSISKNVQVIRGGRAKGIILGGNLSMIHSLLGTKFIPEFKNKILFMEDIAESPHRIDRILCHFNQAGMLKGLRGVIIGRFADSKGRCLKADLRIIKGICEEYFKPLKIPCVFNFPIGHGRENLVIPIGVMAELDAGRKTLICEAPVSG